MKDLYFGKKGIVMITKMQFIPTTETSYPFVSAVKRCHFEELGYVEKEFFMHGTANVYQTEADGEIGIRCQDAPYVNRLVVRAPRDPAVCSGNVVVEIINPTSGKDIERMWIIAHHHFIRNGDIYIGITSKPNTIEKLKEFNPLRYAPLSWSNPTLEQPLPESRSPYKMGDYQQYYETGLFWDMLTDLAHAIRDKSGICPISEYPYRNIILTGWSQSACYMTRYIRSFAYRPEVKRDGCVFDGYLSGAAPRSLPIPVNQYESNRITDSQETRVSFVQQPYLVVQTESENAEMTAYATVKSDSDNPDFLYRVYEFAGPSHDTKQSSIDYYAGDETLDAIGHKPVYLGLHDTPNDYPYRYLFAATYQHLYHWINAGIAPVHCPRIVTDGKGNNVRDALGNAIGGARTCLIDYPTAAYYYYSTIERGASFLDPLSDRDILFGHEEVFPPQMLKIMYGSLTEYTRLVTQRTKIHVTKGFILREDAQALIELAVSYAKQRGLEE